MFRPGLDEIGSPASDGGDEARGAGIAAALDAQLDALSRARALLGSRPSWIDADLAMRLGETSEDVANRLLDLSETMSRHVRDLRNSLPQSANSNLKPSS